MANSVLMPKAGISVESCVITEWLKKPGDAIKAGDILFRYETDKASFECESTESGTLLEIFFENGDEVPCLVAVCAVGNPGEDVSALRPAGGSEPSVQPETPAAAQKAPESVETPSAEYAVTGDAKISPRAKNLAAKHHVRAENLAGSGPHGRVIERDVRALIASGGGATPAAFAAAGGGAYAGTAIGGRTGVADLNSPVIPAVQPAAAVPDAGEFEDIAFSGIRRAISKSMALSLSTIPQLTHNHRFDATELLGLREKFKQSAAANGSTNITLGDMVMFAVSRLLPDYPDLNAHMIDPFTIRRFRDVNLGFACDTERGLMVPVVKRANLKTLSEISAEVKALAKAAQSGALSPDDMAGGTFTVSNLGVFGVESFTPVINPPQTGILGVNCLTDEIRVNGGKIEAYKSMGLSLTYDHRAIDGAPAARFAKELCGLLENFLLLLAR